MNLIENLIRRTIKEVTEEKKLGEFEAFAQKRHDGAKKIAETAKAKGGFAMLTYHHFIVKLPYYKKAAAGKFDVEQSKKELSSFMKESCSLGKNVEISQTEFQKLIGKIEVLGELIIKYKK